MFKKYILPFSMILILILAAGCRSPEERSLEGRAIEDGKIDGKKSSQQKAKGGAKAIKEKDW